MNKERKKNYISIFCILCIIVLLIMISLMLIFTGAKSFESVKKGTDRTYKGNTALNYIINKIHCFDNGGIVLDKSEDGISYIELKDDSGQYKTIIYVYDGYLYENLMYSDKCFEKGKGNKILVADDMSVSSDNNLVVVKVKYDGIDYETNVVANAGVCDNIHYMEVYNEE